MEIAEIVNSGTNNFCQSLRDNLKAIPFKYSKIQLKIQKTIFKEVRLP